MSNDTERLLCGNCGHLSRSSNNWLGFCRHPQAERSQYRLYDELGCDEWTPAITKTEARKRLATAAYAMTAAAEALELLETAEALPHAEEMYGAAEMIKQWIIEIEEA